MLIKTIAIMILVLGAGGLAFAWLVMRLRKPYCEKLAMMGSIFDFNAQVKGYFPPYADGMAGAFYVRYRLLPGKRIKGVSGARVEMPVDAKVTWSFKKKDIQNPDPKDFGVSVQAFEELGRLPGFVRVGLARGRLFAYFSAKRAGGVESLLDTSAARQRVLALAYVARKIGCMARL